MIYADAEQKVSAAVKRKKDSSKDAALLARFKGEFPPTLVKVMSGEGVKDGVGFHQLAMQIAITTNALGKPEDLMLKALEVTPHLRRSLTMVDMDGVAAKRLNISWMRVASFGFGKNLRPITS